MQARQIEWSVRSIGFLRASQDSQELGEAGNLSFEQGNALNLPFAEDSFDVVTVSFGLRNMKDYRRAITEMLRVLKPGGSLLCLEASYPTHALVKPVFRLYFRHVVPALASLVTRRKAEYRWLNDSTENFLSKKELADLMQSCGLDDVRYRSFALGVAALHSGKKRAAAPSGKIEATE
jgi:demethylmenaquinone methyltransferase/2-methoxy-6-polyprenyl-1,4-benzoquinol methylase